LKEDNLVSEEDIIGNQPNSTKTIENDLKMRWPSTIKKSHI